MINLIIFWVLYYFFHSIFAAARMKVFFMKVMKLSERAYRLTYVVASTVLLIAILFYTATLSHRYLWGSMFSKFFGLVLATYGIFVVKEAFRNYNTRAFLGLADPGEESKKLVTEGLQSHVRHPLYAGTILILLGFFFYMPTVENLTVVIISLIYIFVGIKIEEKKLQKTFGAQYDDYKKNVPMLIPHFKK